MLGFFKGQNLNKQVRFSIQTLVGNVYWCRIEASVPEGRTWPLAFTAGWILMSCELLDGSTPSSCLALWHDPKWAYHLGMCFISWHIFSYGDTTQKNSPWTILMPSAPWTGVLPVIESVMPLGPNASNSWIISFHQCHPSFPSQVWLLWAKSQTSLINSWYL